MTENKTLTKSLLILLNYHGVWVKQVKCITDGKMSTCSASETTCHGDKMSGIFLPWSYVSYTDGYQLSTLDLW